MKTKTVYVAQDGEQFDNRAACEKYEADGCVHFEPIPTYCEHVPLNRDNLNWLLAGDGSLYYATADKMSRRFAGSFKHPEWATHLVYFGK